MAQRPRITAAMAFNLWYGTGFGCVVGIIMRLPGQDAVVPAFAINLCVMAALWLGIAIADPQEKRRAYGDIGVAVITFVLAAIALRTNPAVLLLGFALQVWWCFQHRSAGWGVIGPIWFMFFAAGANLAFGIVLAVLLYGPVQ